MPSTYDFIIVGGGTAGCLLAHKLSRTASKPSILLLEAGSNPDGEYLRAPSHRYSALMLRPDLDHGYVSEPEAGLDGRQVAYARGKGLGGSSILNFGVFLYGSDEDYNRWAELAGGDEDWNWDAAKKAYHAMENYDFAGSAQYKHLADPSTSEHGTSGSLKIGLPPVLEVGVVPQMEALIEAGEKINLDPNSGDPIGISVFPFSYSKEGRTTSAIAHLLDAPGNLEVWTGAKVERLVFSGERVVGVVTEDGREASSTKEVILTAGTIDTPKLLLLNGIGPKPDLEALSIPVKKHLPGVGQNLSDHILSFMSVEVSGTTNERYSFESSPSLQATASDLWAKDNSGSFALHNSTLYGGFHKLPSLHSTPEFSALPGNLKEWLKRPTVPDYEFISNALLWPPGTQLTPGNSYMTFIAFLMNPQSRGSVTLRSNKASDKPVINLNFLTHPYDVVAFREAIRATWTKIIENPGIKPHVRKTLLGPESLSDEDVDKFARETAGTVWHANGTVRMGREEAGGCVDSAGKVYGIQGLRVADLSVCPVTTNNHTQSTAYFVGSVVGGKVVREWGLDG
ncbi:alcohol oxidase [Ophiobolus disseminans]|uniref:Alcohol oxidase n=1 Tax=Ophiobolus disseminans TaxID=1469910 RepID=A0A6A7A755_9PLEO|nr:alcohol oxidase [Ophiobolus disseminans]